MPCVFCHIISKMLQCDSEFSGFSSETSQCWEELEMSTVCILNVVIIKETQPHFLSLDHFVLSGIVRAQVLNAN